MPTDIPKPAAIWARVSWRRRYTECDQRTLVRREFAAAVTLAGDDEHGDPLDQGMRQVECGRIGNQRGSCAGELRLRTPPSTAREPRPLRTRPRPVTRSVATLKKLTDSRPIARRLKTSSASAKPARTR